jgi:SpoVK/Ycf46/Vps4 family AAA+-type ATPase
LPYLAALTFFSSYATFPATKHISFFVKISLIFLAHYNGGGSKMTAELRETLDMIKSGIPGIHICGDDYAQIDRFVTQLAEALEYEALEWNFGYGLVEFKTKRGRSETETSYEEFLKFICNPANPGKKLALIKNARFVLEGEGNTQNLARLQQTLIYIKTTIAEKKQNAVVVYCDETQFIPVEVSTLVHFVELRPPVSGELEKIAAEFTRDNDIADFSPEKHNELAVACKGMNETAFKQILEQAALEKETFPAKVIEIAKKAKKQAVEKSRLVKLVESADGMNDVGGLRHLKWWLEQKKNAIFDPEGAKEHGVIPAKGILLVGMPGCGKSLSAKAIANEFELPLLNLDIGSLLGKYMGQSEEHLRRALRIAENASPCVLWVDEIEKAFAGVSGDETGTSQRLFGYLLTWLNEKTATVFVVATANDIAVLPPEFLRRGRFDEIFSVDFPTESERVQILEIHLKKALKDSLDAETKEGLLELSKNMDGYAGSDIASLVNSAMETMWNNPGRSTSMLKTLETQRKYIKPLKEVLKEKIEKNREKFGEYKLTSASFDEQSYDIDSNPDAPVEKRTAVASDPRCPETYLLRLAKDPKEQVLLALISNPQCPAGVIMDLCGCTFDAVKTRAEERFSETEAGLLKLANTEGTSEQKLEIIKNIEKIGSDKRDKILRVLAGDDDGVVRRSVMKYPYLPERAWVNMITKASCDVDEALEIAKHPRCPKAVIDIILSKGSSYDDRVFVAALSTDHAIQKLRGAGFLVRGDYSRFFYNNRLPTAIMEAEKEIDFSRIRYLHNHCDTTTTTTIEDIFERTLQSTSPVQ